jgi:hypothetical protein
MALCLGLLGIGVANGQTGPEPAAVSPPLVHASVAERYRLALHHLDQGQPQAARLLLEEIVAERPEFAGAWLDLALAAQQSNDTSAALEHLAYIRQQFLLAPAMAWQIERWQQAWQVPSPSVDAPSVWQGEISVDIGYNDNVNGGLSQDQITLSIPGGGHAIMPIAPGYRPRGDAYAQVGIQAWQRWQLDGGSLHPLLRLRSRHMQSEGDYGQLDLQGGLIYQTIPDDRGRAWQASFLLQHDRLGGTPLIEAQRLVLQRLQSDGRCRLAWGGELERRHYPGLPLGGLLAWLDIGLACKADEATQLATGLRGGHERARSAQRPGGDNRQIELTLQGSRRLPNGSTLDVRWQHSRGWDQEGYSPLLAENAARRLERDFFNLTLRHPLTPDWEARLMLELQRQRSNLEIFSQNARQISLGMSRSF